jgi:uncharacterized membrane protein
MRLFFAGIKQIPIFSISCLTEYFPRFPRPFRTPEGYNLAMFLSLLMGTLDGLRCLTPPAVIAWAAVLGWLNLSGSPLQFMASKIAIGLFAVAAVIELINDKLPSAPSRTAPPGLIARILLGSLSGACISVATGHSAWIGSLLGLAGGLIGCFGGFQVRTRTVKALKCPDFAIALLEDAVAIAGSLLVIKVATSI